MHPTPLSQDTSPFNHQCFYLVSHKIMVPESAVPSVSQSRGPLTSIVPPLDHQPHAGTLAFPVLDGAPWGRTEETWSPAARVSVRGHSPNASSFLCDFFF